jgi:hypothetical protein
MTHKMSILFENKNYVISFCEACGRLVKVFFDGSPYISYDKGDTEASHSFGIGGVTMNAEIDQPEDFFDPFDTDTYDKE